MTAPETLVELAEQCEKAAGPDRELDAQIGRFAAAEFLGAVPDRPQYGCQLFTASLDAAMTLVPEVGDKGPPYPKMWREAPEYWRAHIGYRNKAHGQNGKAATPALALCAAALKARAQAKDSK